MLSKLRASQSATFVKMLRRGIICSLIPLLCMSFFILFFNLNQSLARLGALSRGMLFQSDQMAAYILTDLQRSAQSLARDSTVVDFAMRPYLRDTERNTSIRASLSNLANSYDYVENISLFSPKESLRISSSGAISYGEREELSAYLSALRTADIHTEILYPEGTTPRMIIAVGIPFASRAPLAVAVLQVDLSTLLALCISDGSDGSLRNLYVLDPSGALLFSDTQLEWTGDLSELRMDTTQTGSGLKTARAGLLQYSVFVSGRSGWQFVYISNALSGSSSLSTLLLPLLISVLAACMIGLLLAYQSSKVLYSPLLKLISSLKEPAAVSEPPQDEYQWLSDYYDQLLNQRDEVYQQVNAVRPLLLKKFLLSLADGTQNSPDEIQYQIKVLDIPFQMTFFNALLLQLDGYYALPCSEEEKRDIKDQMQAQIGSYSNHEVYCTTAELDDETLLVICNFQAADTQEAARQTLHALAEEMKKELSKHWPLTVTIGLGRICSSPEALPVSCQQAKSALAYKLYRGAGRIIDFDETQMEPRQIYYDFEKIHQLVNYVRSGDEKNTRELLNMLFEELSSLHQLPPEQVRSILEYLTAGIGEVIQAADLTAELGTREELDQELAHKVTLPEIEQWITDICLRTASAVRSSRSDRIRKNAEQIKAYIDDNLTKDISLSSISEYVNYSPTYVSKVFRQYYATSYIDYVNSSRVKLSQQLLSTRKDLSVKEVGFQVGFNNMQTFFRIFKKYVGMTPMQFREHEPPS